VPIGRSRVTWRAGESEAPAKLLGPRLVASVASDETGGLHRGTVEAKTAKWKPCKSGEWAQALRGFVRGEDLPKAARRKARLIKRSS